MLGLAAQERHACSLYPTGCPFNGRFGLYAAIKCLGTERVVNEALKLGATIPFSDFAPINIYWIRQWWHASLILANFCERLGRDAGLDPGISHLVGLLSHMGIAVLYAQWPNEHNYPEFVLNIHLP